MSQQLDSHLIASTSPQSPPSQIILKNGLRITVLTDRLFRAEASLDGSFTDCATQKVWNRTLDTPDYTVTESDRYIRIRTQDLTLRYDKEDKEYGIIFPDGRGVYCNNRGNLSGTARTLDQKAGAVELDLGVISRSGVAVLTDESLFLKEDGTIAPRALGREDIYIFAYGTDYRGALKDYYRLTGRVPLIPRYALGNWWSRYYAYSQDEYLHLMERFRREGIPLTVATIDMDWHWVDVEKRFGVKAKKSFYWNGPGWTGYSWNTELFPDHTAFLHRLHEMGLKVTLNLHPAQGVRFFEDSYPQMAQAMGIDPESKEPVPFDAASPAFLNAYFKILHKPYEQEGVDFWWVDWQQGTSSGLEGLDPLWALNHYHFLDSASSGRRPLILSRYAGPGSHRYPLGFSGDTYSLWSALDFQPYFTSTAANIGYTWWSHDIGGHMAGYHDEELYLRWIQFGVFSPIMRLHSSRSYLTGKEPWNHRCDIAHYASEFLRLRHRMIPYLYTMNYRTHTEGAALCEPMYYSWPKEPDAYAHPNEYMFGSQLLVCPITQKADKDTALASVDAWIPPGRWTDLFTGYIYEEKGVRTLFREESSIPVLLIEGGIVPLGMDEGNGCPLPEHMELLLSHGNGRFELYEDDGETMDYEQNHVTTLFEQAKQDRTLEVTIHPAVFSAGSRPAFYPEKRKYSIRFLDVESAKAAVTCDSRPLEYRIQNCPLRIELPPLPPKSTVRITLTEAEVLVNPPLRERAVEFLARCPGSNLLNGLRAFKLADAGSDEEFRKLLEASRFPDVLKDAIEELYFT